ncbi:FkbM family methyltransferase [Phenylobacterium sp.]|uniref:FkbM family methyltransferase n=1 Tax=Phenylobacterium sp. TaxID=1871053 RepID=UPI0025FEA7BE|nr:FkbM family methyltransferase [Phenylobacterium sp.]
MTSATKTLTTRHGPMLSLKGDVYMTTCLEVYGEFSPGEWQLFEKVIRPGMTVVEIGANIGAHTVPMARACRPGPMYVFEPQQRIFQILCANLALNDIDNVIASPDACGPEAGRAVIPPMDYAGKENFGGVSLIAEGSAGQSVRVMPLDELNLPACGLIKIDVEGFEAEVLAGAAATILRCRPLLYVENDRPEHQVQLIRLIEALGYDLYWHTPPLAGPGNFNGHESLVFEKNILSLNMLCLPRERVMKTDLEAIDPAHPRLAAALGGGPAGGG